MINWWRNWRAQRAIDWQRAKHNAEVDWKIRELEYEKGTLAEYINTTNSMPQESKRAAYDAGAARLDQRIQQLKESRV